MVKRTFFRQHVDNVKFWDNPFKYLLYPKKYYSKRYLKDLKFKLKKQYPKQHKKWAQEKAKNADFTIK